MKTPTVIIALALATTNCVQAGWQDGSGGRVMWDSNCDFQGQDIYEVQGDSSICGDRCANDARCTHWSWNSYNEGTCWMKNGGSGVKQSADGVGCGYVKGRFNPDGGDDGGVGFTRFFDENSFNRAFPGRHSLYNFQGLVNAVQAYPSFANTGDDIADKRELAAFLAQTAHESDNFKAPEEYAAPTYPVNQYCDPTWVPCAPGRRYHGRGPIQLSWNYNYNNAGKTLGIDLLNNPEQVGTNSAIAWKTGLWFWMTPQKAGRVIHNVVTSWDGFAQSTDIINGGLECGPSAPAKHKEASRIQKYQAMCQMLGVSPVSKVSCNQ